MMPPLEMPRTMGMPAMPVSICGCVIDRRCWSASLSRAFSKAKKLFVVQCFMINR